MFSKNLRLSILNCVIGLGLVLLSTVSAFGRSQLDSLISVAVRHNPEIRMAQYESMAAQAKLEPAGQLPDPELRVGAMNVPSDFNFTSETMTMAPEFTLMEMFPWFGKLSAAADAEKYGYESSSDRLASVALDVVTNLKKIYGELYSVEKSVQYLEYKKRLLQGVVRVAEQLFAVGQVPQQDVFRATAELTMVQSAIVLKRGELSELEAKLGAILGRNESYRLQVDTLMLPDLAPLSTLEIRLREGSPDLSEVRNVQRAAEAKEVLARKAAVPDITAGVSYGFRSALIPGGMKAPNLISVEFGVNIPIFFGARQQKMIDEADFMRRAADQQYGVVTLALYSRLRSSYANAAAQKELIPLYANELIPQYEATYNSSLSAYSVGKTTFAMLIDNLTTLINAKIEFVKIESAYFSASADISRLVGEGSESYKGVK